MPGQDLSEERLGEILATEDSGEMIDKLVDEIKKKLPQGTAVDGPAHYNGYQVLEAICDAGLGRGFCLGNAVKYLLRAEKKGNDKEDLEKAQFYLNWYIEHYYDQHEGDTDGK